MQPQVAEPIGLSVPRFLDLLHVFIAADVLEDFCRVHLVDFAQELDLTLDLAELVQRQIVVILLRHGDEAVFFRV